MISLVIAIVAIALVAVFTAVSTYHGGETLSEGGLRAAASRLINQGTQIHSASRIYTSMTGIQAENIEALVGDFISYIPESMVGGQWSLAQGQVSLVGADISDPLCHMVNRNSGIPVPENGFPDLSLAEAYPSNVLCIEQSGAREIVVGGLVAGSGGNGATANGPFTPPVGKFALNPNGITVHCLGMPDGTVGELNGRTYRVVYSKADALSYAEIACTSNMNDMSNVFLNNSSFNVNISHWDTSKVTDFNYMFSGAIAFNQPIGSWNTAAATQMNYMFRFTSAFNQDLDTWNVSNVESMTYMFGDASKFNGNISSWKTSKVNNFQHIFHNAVSFNQDIGGWDLSSVSSPMMDFFFTGAKAFNQDLSRWCVPSIPSKPRAFDSQTYSWNKTGRMPVWGTCPAR